MSPTVSSTKPSATSGHSRYDEYKDSGVEWLREIPAHWDIVRVQHAAEIHPSSVDKKSEEDETSVKLCNYTDVYYGHRITDASDFMEATATDSEIETHELQAGDVLITKDSESRDDIAVPAVVGRDMPGVLCGYHLAQLRPANRIDGNYLYYCFKTPSVSAQFEAAATGITRYGLGVHALKKSHLYLPPLDEQRAIAAYLDRKTERIDALIEKKRQLIDLLEEKRKSLISRVVTKGLDDDAEMQDSGVEWLGEIPAGWDVARLKFLSEVQSGIAKGKRYDDNVETVELPYLRVANVQDGFLNLDEVSEIEVATDEVGRYLLRAGDVLMTEGGDYDKLGRGTVWNGDIEPCLHQNHIFAVRPRLVESEWVALITQARYAKHFFIVQSVQSTNLASISMSSLQDLPVVVPPQETRQPILDHVDRETERIDTLTRKVEAAIDRLKEYRTALISAAVTGQIDVRKSTPQPAGSQLS